MCLYIVTQYLVHQGGVQTRFCAGCLTSILKSVLLQQKIVFPSSIEQLKDKIDAVILTVMGVKRGFCSKQKDIN
jgi:hypothetical protein